MDDSLQMSGQHCYGGGSRDWCYQELTPSGWSSTQHSPKGRDFINTFLEGNIVVRREVVPVAVQVNGNSKGELGL